MDEPLDDRPTAPVPDTPAPAAAAGCEPARPEWWRSAVVYQVYVRSFRDADGDGVGDLDGIRTELPYIADLGVDAIWLNPCYPSPQVDHGYDVADYFDIHHEYGTLATFDGLVAEAHRHGLRVLMDLVPNHCSDQHPWFVEALAAPPESAARARFWFRDGRPARDGDPHGAPPNNWQAAFGNSAWTRASPTDTQWYLGTFTPQQPDFDHRDPDVRSMFEDIFEFWFDRGVDGFRVDAISPVGKHPDLPDQPPVPEGTDVLQITWLNPYSVFRPEGHDVWRYFRAAIDRYAEAHPARDPMMVAEAYMARRPDLVDAFTRPDQFHQVFAFDLMLAPWDAAEVERAVRDTIRVLDAGVAPCWTLNNHDIQRIVTRLGRTDADDVAAWTGNNLLQSDADVDEDLGRRRALALTAFMMAMPGSVYLYQGEELGLPEVLDLPDSAREDPVFRYTNGTQLGRDGCRVPLPWTADVSTSFGFSAPATDDEPDRSPSEPWLPQPDDWGRYAVADQIDDHDSTLHLYRTLAACRRTHATPQPDELALVGAPAGVVVARRGALIVVLNTTDRDVRYRPETAATVVFATTPSDDDTIPANSTVWFAMAP